MQPGALSGNIILFMKRTPIYTRGIVTLELLIALAVGMIMLSGVILVSFGGQTAGLDTQLGEHGLYTASTHMENLVASVIKGWNNPVYPTVNADNFYATSSAITDISPCLKGIGNAVQWHSEKERPLGINFDTLLSSVAVAKAMGGGCDPFPPGEWKHPDSAGWTDPDADIPSATGVAVASINGRRYAFVTSEYSPAPGKHSFWVIDVSNPNGTLPIIKSIDLNVGLNGIAIGKINGGVYAFVITDQNEGQLQVINITDPENNPFKIISASSTLPKFANGIAKSIYYNDKKIYIGTNYGNCGSGCSDPEKNNELHIYNVSDPSVPAHAGSIWVNRDVNAIGVQDGFIYLATGPGAAGSNNPLKIYNSISLTPSGSFIATQTQNQAGTSVYILGNKLYLGLQYATDSSRKDFYILNPDKLFFGIPSNDAILGSIRNREACAKQPNCGLGSGSEITDIIVQGRYAFLSTSEQTAGFQVWDISNPENIRQPSMCSTYNYSEKASDIAYADKYVFVTNLTQSKLRVIHNKDDSTQCPL